MSISKNRGAKTAVYTKEEPIHVTIKRDLRNLFKALRSSLSEEERALKSEKILKNLIAQREYIDAQTVFIYMSCGSEADTHKIIEKMISDGKKIAIPYLEKTQGIMKPALFTGFSTLVKNSFGIAEPAESALEFIEAEQIDLVITPGLAFDKSGFRLGYGGGYYDRFFAETAAFKEKEPKKVGIAFIEQISERNLPKSEHDIPVDNIITDRGVLECANADD